MKKLLFAVALTTVAMGLTSCGEDDDVTVIPEGTADVTLDLNDEDVTSSNVANWTAYAEKVAYLLEQDAQKLYEDWSVGYKGGEAFATQFKNHQAPYTSAESCVEQIIDGCIDIANEVGTAKIGDPRDLWEMGSKDPKKYTEAVYAVESWYSFHSIDDYANNIRSIQNAFNGSRDGKTEATQSLAAYLHTHNNALYTETKSRISEAISAIEGMKAPFRNYIGSATVLVAQDACAALNNTLDNKVKSFISNCDDEAAFTAIVNNYVDNVVLPTYKELAEANKALHTAVKALRSNPCTSTFKVAAQAWMTARSPWEKSEAFLFGPVDEEGLDPNMDSWPLDQDAISNILKTGNFGDLDISDGASDEEAEAAQNVRGFHTMEYLLFKNGNPRQY